MLQLALGKQRPRRVQRLDIADIRRAFFAIRLDDELPAEKGQVAAIGAIRLNIIGHRQTEFQPHLIVVIAVAWRGVDEAGAGIIGDMRARQHRHREIPYAIAAVDAGVGMG